MRTRLVVSVVTAVAVAGGSWSRLGLRLPRTPVMELRVHAPSDRLFAGTFGRGIYSIRMR